MTSKAGTINLDSPTAKTTDWDKIKKPMMVALKSSTISEVGHDANGLFVTFLKGKTYHYPDVTADEYNALRTAESAGRHLREHILHKHTGKRLPE